MEEIKNNKTQRIGKWVKFAVMLLAVFQITFVYIQPRTAHAAVSLTQICSPDQDAVGSGLNLQRCVNNIYIFSIAIGGFAAVMFFVFAGYLYTFGTAESVKQAKSIMGSTLAGLILLFIAYAFLNTIGGKSLTSLTSLNTLPEIHCPRGTDCNLNPNIVLPGGDAQPVAQNILNDANIKKADGTSSSADCKGNGPLQNLQDIAAGRQAVYDGPGAICNVGKTNINTYMLGGLAALSQSGIGFTITSLTSGHHASTTDPHYSGNAVDLVPDGVNSGIQSKTIAFLHSRGANEVAVECTLNGAHQYIIVPAKGTGDNCLGKAGYHIHAQW